MARRVLTALLFAVAVTGPLVLATVDRPAAGEPAVERAPGLRGGALPPDLAGARAPAIDLTDARGGRGGSAVMAGRPYLVTFLYTRCRDVCPATAATIATALDELGTRAADVGVLIVSVDPRGDTPAAARRFLRRHGLGANVHYLVGSGHELRRVWNAWLVAGRESGGPAEHSLATWLVDAHGRLRAVYAGEVPPAGDLAHDLAAVT